MKNPLRLLALSSLLGASALLTGCVVAPVAPRPVVYAPQPVYGNPQAVYVNPQPVYVAPPPVVVVPSVRMGWGWGWGGRHGH